MQSKAATVKAYLDSLPEDRRKIVSEVRKVIRKNLGKGYKEGMQYGMIGYFVPHSVYPPGYHCDPKQPLPFAGLANQKNHIGIYLFCLYCEPKMLSWFQNAWKSAGHKLDMGKSCIRFKKLEDVPLDVLGEAIARVPVDLFVESYESNLKPSTRSSKPTTKKTSARKRTVKKAAARKKTTGKRKTKNTKSAKR